MRAGAFFFGRTTGTVRTESRPRGNPARVAHVQFLRQDLQFTRAPRPYISLHVLFQERHHHQEFPCSTDTSESPRCSPP